MTGRGPSRRTPAYPAGAVAGILRDALGNAGLSRRHPAEVTSDRLGDAVKRWGDQLTGAELDAIAVIRAALQEIAEGKRDRG